jgi:four helix bundle protein
MNNISSFQDLNCWKECRILVKMVSDLVKTLPKFEFNLIDNIQRAVRSVTRNIAEGFGRFHHKENIQFCRISRGSLYETWDDLITCLEEGYLTKSGMEVFVTQINKCLAILNGYINYLSTLVKN